HAGSAIAALQRVLLRERRAQPRHQQIVFESFDRTHTRAVASDRVGDAGTRDLAVDHDRARAADTVLAADVRAGQQELLAQEIGELGARFDVAVEMRAVHREADEVYMVVACTSARLVTRACITCLSRYSLRRSRR